MEPLTEWQVSVMINNALERYDSKQESRHLDNTRRLDALKRSIDEARGAKDLAVWVIPIVISAFLLATEILKIVK